MAFDKNAVFSVVLFFVITSRWDFSTSLTNWLCLFFISLCNILYHSYKISEFIYSDIILVNLWLPVINLLIQVVLSEVMKASTFIIFNPP